MSPRTWAPVRHITSLRHSRGGPWGGGVAGPLWGSAAEGLRDNTVWFPWVRQRKLLPREVGWAGQGQTKTWAWACCILQHLSLAAAYFSITTNKASGGDGIPVELFQILKDDAVKVLHSICQQIWKTQQGPQDWKTSAFIPIPKKGNAKECSNYHTIALISH